MSYGTLKNKGVNLIESIKLVLYHWDHSYRTGDKVVVFICALSACLGVGIIIGVWLSPEVQ